MNNIFLWVIQILLAVLFGMAGVMKLTQPKKKLESKLSWVKDFSAGMVKFIGASEFLGALGLILPMAFGIGVILTPLAATGLGLIMIFASIYHIGKKEYSALFMTIVLFTLSAIVAYGRF